LGMGCPPVDNYQPKGLKSSPKKKGERNVPTYGEGEKTYKTRISERSGKGVRGEHSRARASKGKGKKNQNRQIKPEGGAKVCKAQW